VFYNDTIAKQQVGDSAGIPRYTYIRLAAAYSPSGTDTRFFFKRLTQKEKVLPMLPLLKEEVLPRVPGTFTLHSFLLVDSTRLRGFGASGLGTTTTLNKPYIGFNTIVLKAVNADTMSVTGRKNYVAAVLAMLMLRKLVVEYGTRLNTDFHSISMNKVPDMLVYSTLLSVLSPDESLGLEDFGFIKHSSTDPFGLSTPYQQDDLIAYLEALFFYDTTAQFEAVYAAYPLVLQKFKVIKGLAKEIGFRFAD